MMEKDHKKKMPSVPDYEFDQDVSTDEEAYHGSRNQVQTQYVAAMREYLAMKYLASNTLKNATIL